MAAMNTAIALVSLLGGFVIRPVTQPFLPSFLQQQPVVETPPLPFRVEYIPTRCAPTVLPTTIAALVPDVGFDWINACDVAGVLLLLRLGTLASVILLSGKNSAVSKLQSNLAQLEETVNQLTNDLENEKAANGQATKTVEELENELSGTNERISQLEIEKKQLVENHRIITKELEDEKAANGQAKTSLEEVQTKLDGANNQISQLEKEKSVVKENYTSTANDLKTANEKIASLENEKKQRNENPQKTTNDVKSANAKISQLKSEKDLLEKNYGAIVNHRKTANDKVSQLEAEKGQLKQDCDSLTGQLKTANGQISELKQKLSGADGKVSQLESDYAQLKQGRDDVFNHLKSANDQISHLQTANETTATELNDLKASLEEKATAKADSVIQDFYDQMEAKSDAMKTSIATLKKQNAHLESLLARACRCKQGGGSNGKDGDDSDESGGNEPYRDQNAGGSDESKADDTATPNSHDQQDDTAPGGSAPAPDSSAKGSNTDPHDVNASAPEQDSTPDQDSDDVGADDAEDAPKVKLPTPGGQPRYFVRPAGFDTMSRSQQRRYQRNWKTEIGIHGDPQQAHANLAVMIARAPHWAPQ